VINKNIIVPVLAALLLLAPLWVSAQHEEDASYAGDGMTGSATLGGGGVGVDNRSFKFGEYNGLEDGGGFVEFDADLTYNHGPHYLDFTADNLGIDNRSLYLEAGDYGSYSFFASYSETPHLTSGNSSTPFVDPYASFLTLPGGFAVGDPTTSQTTLSSDLRPVELRIDRRTAIFGASKTFGENEFELSYKRETKDGLQALGAGLGNSTGIHVPEAVEQIAHEITAVFAHNGENHQFQLEYLFSLFDNDRESITFEDPFDSCAFTPAGASFTICRISRAPDNQYHKVSLTGGWNVSETTRISAVAEYGMMRQDDNLLPYSTTPTAIPIPRATADALIHTVHLNLRAAFNPSPGLSFGARFRHYQTINDTPKTLFLFDSEDENDQVSPTEEEARETRPYDYLQEELILDASYKLFKGTYIKAKYEFEYMDRSFRAVEETIENMVEGRIRSTFIPLTSFTAHGSFSRKDGLDFDHLIVYRSSHSAAYLAANPTGFENHPAVRKFDIADRDRVKAGASLSIFPIDAVTLGAGYEYFDDDYRNTPLGLNYRTTHNVTADISYAHREGMTFYAYYNYRNSDFMQTGCESCSNPLDPGDAFWEVMHDDDSHTVGAGANLTFLDDRLVFNLDYSYTESAGDIRITDEGAPTPPIATLLSELHRFEVSGEYKALDRLTVGVRYIMEDYSDTDFATDQIDTSTQTFQGDILWISGSEPDYTGHIASLFATWTFGDID